MNSAHSRKNKIASFQRNKASKTMHPNKTCSKCKNIIHLICHMHLLVLEETELEFKQLQSTIRMYPIHFFLYMFTFIIHITFFLVYSPQSLFHFWRCHMEMILILFWISPTLKVFHIACFPYNHVILDYKLSV